jgi:hypothetical protein
MANDRTVLRLLGFTGRPAVPQRTAAQVRGGPGQIRHRAPAVDRLPCPPPLQRFRSVQSPTAAYGGLRQSEHSPFAWVWLCYTARFWRVSGLHTPQDVLCRYVCMYSVLGLSKKLSVPGRRPSDFEILGLAQARMSGE